MTPADLTTLTPTVLDRLHLDVLSERERRQRIEQAPQHITSAITDARAVGVDAALIRATIDNAMEA